MSITDTPKTYLPDEFSPEFAQQYPEEYLVWEDENLTSTEIHIYLANYLIQVLLWHFREQGWYMSREILMTHGSVRNTRTMIVPDVFVIFKKLSWEEQRRITSWAIKPPKKPAPRVVIELMSEGTWEHDVGEEESDKPAIYGRIGVVEYFGYDPNERRVWRGSGGRRLIGWRYVDGEKQEIEPNEQGWLWSEELESWLVPDEEYLRLYDREGNIRLTGKEAAERAKEAAERAKEAAEREVVELRLREEAQVRENAEVRQREEAQVRENAELRRQLEQLRKQPPNGQ